MLGDYLRVLTPDRSQLQSVSGGRLVQLTGVEEISAEAGRTGVRALLLEPPGLTSATILVDLGPLRSKRTPRSASTGLTVQKEAGRPAEPLSVTVTVPEGATILEVSAGMAVNGRTATLQTTAATDVQAVGPLQPAETGHLGLARGCRAGIARNLRGRRVASVPRVYHRSAIARGSTLHMDLRRQLTILRAWLWLLIASVLLAASAAFLVSGTMPKIYRPRTRCSWASR